MNIYSSLSKGNITTSSFFHISNYLFTPIEPEFISSNCRYINISHTFEFQTHVHVYIYEYKYAQIINERKLLGKICKKMNFNKIWRLYSVFLADLFG